MQIPELRFLDPHQPLTAHFKTEICVSMEKWQLDNYNPAALKAVSWGNWDFTAPPPHYGKTWTPNV